MSLAFPFRLKCASIPYRQGFIEVTPAIHKGCINLETWKVDVATSFENASWLDDPNLSDSYVSANCELEMTVAEARSLAEAILEALGSLES